MKRIIITVAFFFCFFVMKAQSKMDLVAQKISQRMKDSLQLSDSQQVKIYQINLELAQKKLDLRRQYSIPDSLRVYTQEIEKTRDVLYLGILTPEQFTLYREKKRNLVNNN